MGREIYDIINDMAEVLNASQMQKLQEVLVKRLSENTVSDYLQTTNMDFLDMFLTAKHLEGCSDKTIRYYRCNIEKMLDTINIPVIKITTEMLRKYLVEYQTINKTAVIVKDTFAQKYGITKIILFGSRVRGTNTERSDIDIAVYGGDFDCFYRDD